MRRESDSEPGRRTGRGRRARDRLLTGDPPHAGATAGSSEIDNLLYFISDDLRAAALAMGGIERFLVAARDAVGGDLLVPGEIAELVDGADAGDRLAELEDALSGLLKALDRLRQVVPAAAYEPDAMPTAKIA